MTLKDSRKPEDIVATEVTKEDIGICCIKRVNQIMSVEGHVKDIPINFVVDSRVTCTLISEDKIKQIIGSDVNHTEKLSGRTIRLADGRPLQAEGRLMLEIRLGPVMVEHEAIVARISDEGVIGYDFLLAHGCAMDIGNLEFCLRGKRIPCTESHAEQAAAKSPICESMLPVMQTNLKDKCQRDDIVDLPREVEEGPDQLLPLSVMDSELARDVLVAKVTVELCPESGQLADVSLNEQELTSQEVVKQQTAFKEQCAVSSQDVQQVVVQEKNPNREPVQMNQCIHVALVVGVDECSDLAITKDEESLNQHTVAVWMDGYYGHESPGSGDQSEEIAVASNLRHVAKSEMNEVRTRVVMKEDVQLILKGTSNPRLKRIDAWFKKFKKRLLAVIPITGNEAPMAA